MKHRTVLFALVAGLVLALSGCGAVEEASDEGAKAVENGMATKDRAKGVAEKKEAFQSDNDF